ncbi:MAG: STAS-like domain-containing protein [Opitutales bacterium]|nr:STAS-like domain-containing protein [Opitutales bacterium]
MRSRFDTTFLGDGSEGNRYCTTVVAPILEAGGNVTFDFEGIEGMTDSFANAAFANLFEKHLRLIGTRLLFKGCSPLVKDFLASALAMARSRDNQA